MPNIANVSLMNGSHAVGYFSVFWSGKHHARQNYHQHPPPPPSPRPPIPLPSMETYFGTLATAVNAIRSLYCNCFMSNRIDEMVWPFDGAPESSWIYCFVAIKQTHVFVHNIKNFRYMFRLLRPSIAVAHISKNKWVVLKLFVANAFSHLTCQFKVLKQSLR